MGAKHFVVTSKEDFHKPYAFTFAVIISTRNVAEDFDVPQFCSMLDVNGKFVMVGLPEDKLPAFQAQPLTANGAFLGGSHIGSKKEALAMLKLAADKNIRGPCFVLASRAAC